jgi:hypothetical protein
MNVILEAENKRAQLDQFRHTLRADAPDGAVLVFLRCWVLLYGAVSMEVSGHRSLTLGDLARLVGLEYPLPET